MKRYWSSAGCQIQVCGVWNLAKLLCHSKNRGTLDWLAYSNALLWFKSKVNLTTVQLLTLLSTFALKVKSCNVIKFFTNISFLFVHRCVFHIVTVSGFNMPPTGMEWYGNQTGVLLVDLRVVKWMLHAETIRCMQSSRIWFYWVVEMLSYWILVRLYWVVEMLSYWILVRFCF